MAKNTFQNLKNMINERYQKEICSVDDMISIFTKAIEKEKSIPEKMILRGDTFVIRSISKNSDGLILLSSIGEKLEDIRFTVNQLKQLKDIFQDVAPAGWIPKRSLVYIFQDLVACTDEKYDLKSSLPSYWFTFDTSDIEELISELFLEEDPIDWREFLIYGLNMEMPSVGDLLKAKEAFTKHDKSFSDLISRDLCLSLPFWFVGSKRCLSTTLKHQNMRSKSAKKTISFKLNSSDELLPSRVHIDSKETPRMNSTREFLCELFSADNNRSIDYMTMLFGFCKDVNPKCGLGKALSLALGRRVCWDFDEGENYVCKFQREAGNSDKTSRTDDQDNSQFIKNYLNSLMDSFEEKEVLTDVDNISLTDEAAFYSKSRTLMIERLDEPGKFVDPDNISVNLSSSSINAFLKSEFSSEKSFNLDKEPEPEVVFWVPVETCQFVLSTLIPSKLIETHFEMSLTDFIKEIIKDEISNGSNAILSHRFINHKLTERLIFEVTNKFCHRSVSDATKGILERKKATR